MSDEAPFLPALEHQVSSLAAAPTAADLFRRLLASSRLVAPRAAVYLLRGERWRGWGSQGYPPATADRQRHLELALEDGPFGGLGVPVPEGEPSAVRIEAPPDFGQPPAAEAVVAVVHAGERLVAAVFAEREVAETPWSPEALGILTHVASLRLDLDLLRRKSPVVAPRPEPPSAPPPPPPPSAEFALVPLAADHEASPEARRREEARRFARLVATDIRLYNEEAVMQGRRERDLAQRLTEHLQRGRETFLRRFHDMGQEATAHLREAYVEVLAGGDASLVPEDPQEW